MPATATAIAPASRIDPVDLPGAEPLPPRAALPAPADYHPALHGLRGLACVLIVLHHLAVLHPALLAPLLRSSLRPEIFFVVSGALYRRSMWPITGGAGARAFAARLLRRLYPIYFLFLALSTVAHGAKAWALAHGAGFRSGSVFTADPWVLPKNLLLLQDLPPPFAAPSLNFPSWAISDFVMVALAGAALCALLRGGARVAAFAAAGLAAYAGVAAGPAQPAFDLARCAASFVTGLGVATLAARWQAMAQAYPRSRLAAWRGRPAAVGAALAAAAMVALMQFDGLFPHPFLWMPPLAGALTLALLVGPRGGVRRALEWAPLVRLGKLSYTIILAHALVLIAVEHLLARYAGVQCPVREALCQPGLSLPATVGVAVGVVGVTVALSAVVQRWLGPATGRSSQRPGASVVEVRSQAGA